MAKKNGTTPVESVTGYSHDLMTELSSHYRQWNDDNTKRQTRKRGWNEITDAYYGILPRDWPYMAKTVDPRIRTALLDKNASIVNGKIRGRLVPREGGDVIRGEINNALLDFQWDSATSGGGMSQKVSLCDMDTRLYGTKFVLNEWKSEVDDDGRLVFDGNDTTPLDIRDCGMDSVATHVRDAKWFQHRSWEYAEDLFAMVDTNGEPAFDNLEELKRKLNGRSVTTSSQRKNKFTSRTRQIRGLEDRVGDDIAFPIIEVVTEYRRDRWITFSPEYNLILRDIENPYNHGKIPVSQLTYYRTNDDYIGESEVEPLIPLWLAIQATLCSYLDEVVLKMRPPLVIIEGAARVETIERGPDAQWLVSRPDAITEMQGNGEAVRYFQTTYSALTSAFNTAASQLSQGTSGVDPFNPQKTATEIKFSSQQSNVRDQKNQNDLADFIKDIMSMWLSNNKQFIMDNQEKETFLLRVVGVDKFSYLKRAGLDEMELSGEALSLIKDIITQNPDITPAEINQLYQTGMTPKFPVITNPKEKDPSKLEVKPKMMISDTGDIAEINVIPEDLEGTYDYVPDIKSMSQGFSEEIAATRQKAIEMALNPQAMQMLQMEGWRMKLKELLSSSYDELGFRDSERYFEKVGGEMNGQPNQTAQGGPVQPGMPGSVPPPMPTAGVPNIPQAVPNGGIQQQMAQPGGF